PRQPGAPRDARERRVRVPDLGDGLDRGRHDLRAASGLGERPASPGIPFSLHELILAWPSKMGHSVIPGKRRSGAPGESPRPASPSSGQLLSFDPDPHPEPAPRLPPSRSNSPEAARTPVSATPRK